MKYSKSILLILISFVLFGCTYSVFSNQLPHLKSIYVSPILNMTEESELETEMFNSISNQFITDGRLRIVSQKPDCSLDIEIKSYQDKIYTYDESNNVKEYQISMTFSVKFVDNVNEKEIYSQTSLLKTERYPADISDPDYSESTILTKEEAREEIYLDLFKTIMSNTLEAW